MPVSHLYVVLVTFVNAVTALRALYVHVGHLGVFANSLPEDIALIVTDVYAMDVTAGVFALHLLNTLGMQGGGYQREYK